MPPTYSLILPAYNEEKIIATTIDTIHKFLSEQKKSFEIIVASDGSQDKTQEIVLQKMKTYKELRLVTTPTNQGKGATLTRAFQTAKGDIQLYIDADLAIDLNLFHQLVSALEQGADIAIASKHHPQAQVQYSFLRKIFSKTYSFLARTLLSAPIYDATCGFKAFKKEALQKVLPLVKEQGWTWDTEIIFKSAWLGLKIVEIPAIVFDIQDRKSKIHLLRDTRRMAAGLYRAWKEKNI